MTVVDRKQPVLFAGENHLITLFQPGSHSAVVTASCWRCTYSAHGQGTVLAFWCDNAAVGCPEAPAAALYTDNLALGRMVNELFNQYFAGFRERGFAQIAPQAARFAQLADVPRFYQVTCAAGAVTIDLVWHNVFEAALEIFDNTSGPEPYDVSAVICSCMEGRISLNGTALQGEVRRPAGAAVSSAFLAFSETWCARGDRVGSD